MKIRKVLYAEKGMVLTDGADFGTIIYLADGKDETAFYEITEAEYEEILKEQRLRSEV